MAQSDPDINIPDPVEPAHRPDADAASEPGAVRTVSFVSLGCPKNLVDSEHMLGLLAQDGIAPVSAGAGTNREDLSVAGSEQDTEMAPQIDPADAVVVNTCGFLEASKQESMSVIRAAVDAKQRGEIKRVVVAGCLVQRHRAKMLEWEPGIDAMVGVHDRDKIVEAVRGSRPSVEARADIAGDHAPPPYWINANALTAARSRGIDTVGLTVSGKADGSSSKGLGYYERDDARLRLTPRHYAYLRISEGCNQKCAFCTIPSIRGKMRSKPAERILDEARELVRDGAFELLMIGQDTTSYGDDIGTGLLSSGGELLPLTEAGMRAARGLTDDELFASGLPKLLRDLSDTVKQEAGNGWLRLMYAYPTTFDARMVEAFGRLSEQGLLLPYLDIPLQHASDRVLELMRRNVTRAQQADLCHALRDRVAGMAIRTTFISGFPGETDDDHAELLGFVDEIGFDAVGVFTYSTEPGTVAGTMAGDDTLAVPEEVKQARKDEVMELQQRLAFEQNEFLAEQFDANSPTDSGVVLDVVIDERTGEATSAGDAAAIVAGPGGSTAHVHRGRTYFQAPGIDACTYVQSREPLSPGELVKCTIVASDGYDLIARPSTEFTTRVSLPVV